MNCRARDDVSRQPWFAAPLGIRELCKKYLAAKGLLNVCLSAVQKDENADVGIRWCLIVPLMRGAQLCFRAAVRDCVSIRQSIVGLLAPHRLVDAARRFAAYELSGDEYQRITREVDGSGP
jgi:hypothetical protein